MEKETEQGNLGGDLLLAKDSYLQKLKRHLAALEKRAAIPVRSKTALNQWHKTKERDQGATAFIEMYTICIGKEEGWSGLDVWKPQEYMNVIIAYKEYCETCYAISIGDLERFQERSTRLWYLIRVSRELTEYVEEHRNGSHESTGHAVRGDVDVA